MKRVVHLVVDGTAACGFSRELPVNWPLGHTGVRPDIAYYSATCEPCKKQVPPPESDDDVYFGWPA